MQIIYVNETKDFHLDPIKSKHIGYEASDKHLLRLRENYVSLGKELTLPSKVAIVSNFGGNRPTIPPEDEITNPSSPYFPLAYISKIRELLNEPDEGLIHGHYVYRMTAALLASAVHYFEEKELLTLGILTAIPYDRQAISGLADLARDIPDGHPCRKMASDSHNTLLSLMSSKMDRLNEVENHIKADLSAHGLPEDFPIKNTIPHFEILDVHIADLVEGQEVPRVFAGFPPEIVPIVQRFGKTQSLTLSGTFNPKPSLEEILSHLDNPQTIITDIPFWKHYPQIDSYQTTYQAFHGSDVMRV